MQTLISMFITPFSELVADYVEEQGGETFYNYKKVLLLKTYFLNRDIHYAWCLRRHDSSSWWWSANWKRIHRRYDRFGMFSCKCFLFFLLIHFIKKFLWIGRSTRKTIIRQWQAQYVGPWNVHLAELARANQLSTPWTTNYLDQLGWTLLRN